MSSNTLDRLGRIVLEAIDQRRATIETLESELDCTGIEKRVRQLEENALVRTGNDGAYELTQNGRRVLAASPRGTHHNRIETQAGVECTLDASSLRPDENAAVRRAFSFLRYWGTVTAAELINAVYSEFPAGYETAEEWWDDCVRDSLASLPDVHRSPDAVTTWWQYDGTPEVALPEDDDGRSVDEVAIGSVRHALEELELCEAERTAARSAFAVLHDHGEISIADLADRVYEQYPAGHDSIDAWNEWLSSVFERLPEIDRERETDDGVVWRYQPSFPEDRDE